MKIIQNASGSQLDPEMVRSFTRRVEDDEAWLTAIRPLPPDAKIG